MGGAQSRIEERSLHHSFADLCLEVSTWYVCVRATPAPSGAVALRTQQITLCIALFGKPNVRVMPTLHDGPRGKRTQTCRTGRQEQRVACMDPLVFAQIQMPSRSIGASMSSDECEKHHLHVQGT
jgi:hypothetical protein